MRSEHKSEIINECIDIAKIYFIYLTLILDLITINYNNEFVKSLSFYLKVNLAMCCRVLKTILSSS